MIKAECDRCGAQNQTDGVAMTIGPFSSTKVRLPKGWYETPVPPGEDHNEAVELTRVQLCKACVKALREFLMAGSEPIALDQLVDSLLTIKHVTPLERLKATSVPLARCPISPGGCVAHGGPDCACEDPSAGPEPLCGGYFVKGHYGEHARQHHGEFPGCTVCDEPCRWDTDKRRWQHKNRAGVGFGHDHGASVLLRDRSAENNQRD
jgi:hypothetical protein